MPDKDIHLRQARHNEEFVNNFDIVSSTFLDWLIVGVFYSSVHYIEAFLATKSVHTRAHTSRDNYVEVYFPTNIYDDYRDLKDYSEDARYYCKPITKMGISDSRTKLENIKNHLKTVTPPIL